MKVAVVGSGISGLAAALLLSPEHEIHLFEKAARFGGHSRTLDVPEGSGQQPVDTGFIVFNRRNYPLLCRLFEMLQVPVEKSCMSFAVSINRGWLEYGSKGIKALLSQKRNLLRPAFWRMLRDIFHFNRRARRYLDDPRDLSLEECVREMKLGDWFRDYYLLAMGSAIWSTPASRMQDFPAKTFIRFFENHGLLDPADKLQWYTVKGGSRVYVDRILERLPLDNLHPGVEVELLSRTQDGLTLKIGDREESFDSLVLACHSDQSLALLGDAATEEESEILGAIRYQENQVILHQDPSFMPLRKSCWQSWVYLRENNLAGEPRVSMSYWMNNLQNFSSREPVLVTLNPDRLPDGELTLDHWVTQHPQFDGAAIAAQRKLHRIQGKLATWFCGAWTGYGFHEDGLRSAVQVVKQMGVSLPQGWEQG